MSLVVSELVEMNLMRAGLTRLRNRDQKIRIRGQFHEFRWKTRPSSVDYEADVLLVPPKTFSALGFRSFHSWKVGFCSWAVVSFYHVLKTWRLSTPLSIHLAGYAGLMGVCDLVARDGLGYCSTTKMTNSVGSLPSSSRNLGPVS